MTGRLPQMVRTTVDVGLLRGWRGEPSVGGNEGQGDEYVMVGALQGWKAAVDALDQTQRYRVCCVVNAEVGRPTIRALVTLRESCGVSGEQPAWHQYTGPTI